MDIQEAKAAMEAKRPGRLKQTPALLADDAKKALLSTYHPDYRSDAYQTLKVGPNAGEKTVKELADLLEAGSPVLELLKAGTTLTPQEKVDVLIIGGGGAGAAAALEAKAAGANVLLATKLRLGDANTVMAEGGMQAAVNPDDSPIRHFADTLKGGHFKNDRTLLKVLVEEGPSAVLWLMQLGVLFDRDEEGNLKLRSGGGTSTARLLACRDYTGLEMMRVLKDAVINEKIRVMEYAPAIELLSGPDGRCTGAVLKDFDSDRRIVVQAKVVLLTTGGSGRLHIQRFPTSNHFGATGDGLALSYRMGAKLLYIDTFQYHPTGSVYPEPMAGLLVTEALRSAGAQLVNGLGDRFVSELETRDVVASAVIRECREGRGVATPGGRAGVWLDIPVVDELHGEGTIEKRFPNMMRLFSRYGIDIRKEPVLVYPTLHYQNGGVKIDEQCHSTVKQLLVAGEASGGLHGRNRLMGNSLLDIIVFGRRAGRTAAEMAKTADWGATTLGHLKAFEAARAKAGIKSDLTSPMLFPDYVRKAEGVSS
jgi:succinate dehydrogenase / fumarate reductase flavoprotein subunit/L-aspartate oxidase